MSQDKTLKFVGKDPQGNAKGVNVDDTGNIVSSAGPQQRELITIFDGVAINGYSGPQANAGYSFLLIDVSGTFVADVKMFGRLENSSGNRELDIFDLEGNRVDKISNQGMYKVDVSGLKRVYGLIQNYTSGSVTVKGRFVPMSSLQGTVNTPKIRDSYNPGIIEASPGFISPNRVDFDSPVRNVTIVNYSERVPIEIILNKEFTTANLSDRTNRIRIAPCQSIKINTIVTSILYASTIGYVKIGIYTDAVIDFHGSPKETALVGNYGRSSGLGEHRLRAVYKNVFVAFNRTNTSEMKVSIDGGRTLHNTYTFAAPFEQAWVTPSGTILAVSAGDIWRSTDYGGSFTNVTNTGDVIPWHSQNAIHAFGDTIIFAEYGDAEAQKRIWRSADDGATWSAVFTVNTPSEIRHFHTLTYDKAEEKYLATAGDSADQSRWYTSEDGINWSQVTATGGNSIWRSLGQVLGDGYIIWSVDASAKSGVYKVSWEKLTSSEFDVQKDVEMILDAPGLIYATHHIGDVIIVATDGQGDAYGADTAPIIYISRDRGKTWNIVCVADLRSGVPLPSAGWRMAFGPDAQNRMYVPIVGDTIGRGDNFERFDGVIIQM